MTGPRYAGDPKNIVFTSGDPDPLNLDQRDRRFTTITREEQVKREYGEGAIVVAALLVIAVLVAWQGRA